jgi:proteasome lid subunit RPN8/RPN11
MAISVSKRPLPLMQFSRLGWRALLRQLGRRGQGRKEAGAFLLGRPGRDQFKVRKVVYLDDLDPTCLNGGIHFQGLAYSKLWDICEAGGLRVIGDVHTHPGSSVHQSSIDAENPMVSQAGHVALIVPYLATRKVDPSQVGVHLYLGHDGWTTWTGADAAKRLTLRMWP